jgi:hypothetical protein
MRAKLLKTRDLILSLSKDEAKILCFFSSLLDAKRGEGPDVAAARTPREHL